MKLNKNTRILGEKVILVPYRKYHVLKYHDWMSKPDIQELTASEPLTLEEEYEMQAKWQNDSDKLTFILLRRDLFEQSTQNDQSQREIEAMIGDVNCFVSVDLDDDISHLGELEIMIVENENRSKGYGSETVRLMISFCLNYVTNPKIDKFIVKIGEENRASINMFEKLGFVQYEYISAFKQVSLKLNLENFQSIQLKIDENYFE